MILTFKTKHMESPQHTVLAKVFVNSREKSFIPRSGLYVCSYKFQGSSSGRQNNGRLNRFGLAELNECILLVSLHVHCRRSNFPYYIMSSRSSTSPVSSTGGAAASSFFSSVTRNCLASFLDTVLPSTSSLLIRVMTS